MNTHISGSRVTSFVKEGGGGGGATQSPSPPLEPYTRIQWPDTQAYSIYLKQGYFWQMHFFNYYHIDMSAVKKWKSLCAQEQCVFNFKLTGHEICYHCFSWLYITNCSYMSEGKFDTNRPVSNIHTLFTMVILLRNPFPLHISQACNHWRITCIHYISNNWQPTWLLLGGFNQYQLAEPSGGKRWNQLNDLLLLWRVGGGLNPILHRGYILHSRSFRLWLNG